MVCKPVSPFCLSPELSPSYCPYLYLDCANSRMVLAAAWRVLSQPEWCETQELAQLAKAKMYVKIPVLRQDRRFCEI
jgi:hypothetical protein